MNDINKVVLVGRLTRDAELKYTNSGLAITRFSVAVNRRKKQGDDWIEEASFFDIVLWGKLGEAIIKYLIKGKQLAIEGELRQNRWEQDGQSRSKVEIIANNIQLLGGTNSGPQRPNTGNQQQGSTQGAAPQGKSSYGPDNFTGNDQFEDDIPF